MNLHPLFMVHMCNVVLNKQYLLYKIAATIQKVWIYKSCLFKRVARFKEGGEKEMESAQEG